MSSIIDKLIRNKDRSDNSPIIFKTTCRCCGREIMCCEGSYMDMCDICKTTGMYR